jgi:hypothetical protein
MEKLKFVQDGTGLSDDTFNYDVEVDKGCRTLVGFVSAVLRERPTEWGSISFMKDDMSWAYAPRIEYKNGAVLKDIGELDRKYEGWVIDRVIANGGWGNMDYRVYFRKLDEGAKMPAEKERRDDGEVYGGAEGKQMADAMLKVVRAVRKLRALKESEAEADAEGRNEGMQNGEIVNALIENVSLSMADHGVLCYYLTLETNSGGCNFGGRVIGKGELGAEEFEGCAKGTEALMRIMDVVGVEKWEDLKGRYVRVELPGWGGVVDRIGNIIDDKWFSQKEFFGGD